MYGEDWSYAKTRLEGTWVKYNKEPVFVERIDGCNSCLVLPMKPNGDYGIEFVVNMDDLDLCPFNLGYANLGDVALYVSRQPMRRDWKQGLRVENIVVSANGEPTTRYRIRSKGFYDMFMGTYPDFKQALTKSKALGSCAWHKHWAATTGQVLQYKHGEVVGSIVNGKPVLDKGFEYLKESLQESL